MPMQYELTDHAKDTIQNNRQCIRRLAYVLGKSERTIQKWVAKRDLALTQYAALNAIEEETGILVDEAIQPINCQTN